MGGLACNAGGNIGHLFLALTFVLVVIVVLLCRDATTAIAIIGLLLALGAAYLAASGGLGGVGAYPGEVREGYWPLPGAAPPRAVAVGAPRARPRRYPGAIDLDEYDTAGAYGHRDRTEDDSDTVPLGNPYDLSRAHSPAAAGPCVDDEANDAEIDGDERLVYNGLHRNDETRVVAGTMNRRRDMDRYLREEVSQAENRQWWGRHEV